ncbi:hypothetical protein ACWDRR_00770 [Kitasatospora sp. NPDC003701]
MGRPAFAAFATGPMAIACTRRYRLRRIARVRARLLAEGIITPATAPAFYAGFCGGSQPAVTERAFTVAGPLVGPAVRLARLYAVMARAARLVAGTGGRRPLPIFRRKLAVTLARVRTALAALRVRSLAQVLPGLAGAARASA